MEMKSRRTAMVFLALLLILAAVARIVGTPSAMTHVDDIGVASTILEARREFRDVGDLRAVVNNPLLRQHDSTKFKLLRGIDERGLLEPTFGVLSVLRDALAVPARWTYAPGQYFATPLFLSGENSYRQTLAWGRAPSALFSVGAMALLALLAWRRRRPEEFAAPLVATAVMAFSVELFAYSTHMSNYALGVLASTALLGFAALSPTAWRSPVQAFALGVAAWGLTMLSYHVLTLLPAAFAAIGLSALQTHRREQRSLSSVVKSAWFWRLGLACGVFALLIVPTYVVLIGGVRPITWNAGPGNQFVMEAATNPIGFIAENSWLIFSAMTTPVGWDHPARPAVTALLAILFVVGNARLLADRSDDRRRAVGLFIVLSLAATLLLAGFSLTALSPTRHALILLPLFAVGCGEGVAFTLKLVRSSLRMPTLAAFVIGLAALWAANLPQEIARRRNPFDEAGLIALVESVGPAAIVAYDHTYDPELMPAVRARAPIFNEQNLNFPWFANGTPKRAGPTLAISSSPLTSARRVQIAEAVQRSLPPSSPWRWCAEARVLRSDLRPAQATLEVYPLSAGGENGYFMYVLESCAVTPSAPS